MNTGTKFGVVAAVVVAIVAAGWWLSKREKTANMNGQSIVPRWFRPWMHRVGQDDSQFAKNADGSPDYTHYKDGTPVRLT